ncbi:MAG TPA: PASTA domain-containing protein [Chitinophagaceae bacterium]|nr:PASTA domain-containing protein [Chitinophagaceae bacterium]
MNKNKPSLAFLTHRPLWVNVLTGLVLIFAIFFLFLSSLKCLTGHGRSATVPSVTGKNYQDAKVILKKAGFDVDIQDSIYVDTAKPWTILKQIPDGDEVVKSNRTVYLVISRAVPPIMEMPNLVGYSFRNAEMVLKNMDLKIGDTTFKPDFAKNGVLEQWYNGAQIAAGAPIRKGSVVSLVLGDGVGKREFVVPDITGMSFCDAKQLLEGNGIIIGAVVPDVNVEDTCNAYIYKQNPERFDDEKRFNRIRSGQTMDVWLSVGKPVKDSLKKNDEPEEKPARKPDDAGYN